MTSRAKTVQSSLTQHQVDSLVHGTCGDPFSLLGLHANPRGKGLVYRAMVPNAVAVDLINADSGRKIASLQSQHPDGLFEAELGNRKNRFDYRLRVKWADSPVILDDPYRFAPLLSEHDLYLFCEGKHENAQLFIGANPKQVDAVDGVLFSVWAPDASRVSVVGDFNHWNGVAHGMRKHPAAGIWEIFIPALEQFAIYKFEILDAQGQRLPLKADPYAKSMQHPSQTASRAVIQNSFDWQDDAWMRARKDIATVSSPVSIYEVHAGSWRRNADEGNRYLSYLELADQLIPYALDMGFTHIQLMPISEYPFDGSWGYQPVGMFAPSIRFGTPDEFREFVDRCHQQNIGVLLDWVPGHFPTDEHGLGKFDGTCLYEHEDVRKGFHPDWNTLVYNYSRNEVVSYLLSNANYWLHEFHLDGLRVDAVASMLYLDYSRKEGEWLPNKLGGRENLEAIELLQTVNARVYHNHPGIMMIAEESTAWPGVSRPVDAGGLGFGYKWNMGWMNDSLSYIQKDPIYRQHHHDQMTFSTVYAWDENFVLPISHDEVVHGKGSLLNKMPGDDWQKFANLRAYFGFMWGHPGKKLLFMGCEFAQLLEWNHDESLQWTLLQDARHLGVQQLIRDLNRVYCDIPAMHQLDHDASGFEWLQAHNNSVSIFAWLRRGRDGHDVVVISNMTPETHHDYRVGVAVRGTYREILNTDAPQYGGSGQGNGSLVTDHRAHDGQAYSLSLTVPPLATIMLQIS